MKKTLVSALTTALVVGAASTTFAAANPFADVPADHWAYDAVAQLVQDGIVNGYAADGTYKGDQNMSRYEMAQIVAKAMAKSEAADNNNKALIDKLAAEFSDELANLGVRVADLEAKTDNVKWEGLIRYDWKSNNFAANTGHAKTKDGDNTVKLRFEPSMVINENWTGHARIDYDVQKDNTGAASTDVQKIYAEGQYDKFNVKLGRFGTFSDASHGLVMDDQVTGAEFTYAPTEAWKIKATAGRTDVVDKRLAHSMVNKEETNSASYWAVEAGYAQGKWDAGVGYHTVLATNTEQVQGEYNGSYHIVDLGVGYAFDKNVKLTGDYAWGPSVDNTICTTKNAYSIELDYKGADASDPGSWGAYVAYRQLAPFATVSYTYDFGSGNFGFATLKGWEIGADYTFAKNIVATAKYFNGKDQAVAAGDDDKATGVFTRVDFLF